MIQKKDHIEKQIEIILALIFHIKLFEIFKPAYFHENNADYKPTIEKGKK